MVGKVGPKIRGRKPSEEGERVRDQILATLAQGPKDRAQLNEAINLGEKPYAFLTKWLTRLKMRGEIGYVLSTRQWHLADGAEVPPGAVSARPAAGVVNYTPPPRDSDRPPSRVGGPDRTPDPPPPEQSASCASGSADSDKRRPRRAAGSWQPPIPVLCREDELRSLEVRWEAPSPPDRSPPADTEKRRTSVDPPREESRGAPSESGGVSRIQIRVHLSLGPDEVAELGEDAGEVLRSAAILIRAEQLVRRMQEEP